MMMVDVLQNSVEELDCGEYRRIITVQPVNARRGGLSSERTSNGC